MSGLLDFFTKEAGQKRRAWLDEKDAELTGLLSYFAGPHASDAAGKAGGLLATMSDAADFQDYTDASRATMRDPNLGNLAALATAGTALMIPGVSARMAEGAVDFGQDLARFGREEDGAFRAFHASPVDFDRFDASQVGTGEGGRLLGDGINLSRNPAVADFYHDQLSGGRGTRYEVSVNADESDFLDFGAPLSSQSDAVKSAAARLGVDMGEVRPEFRFSNGRGSLYFGSRKRFGDVSETRGGYEAKVGKSSIGTFPTPEAAGRALEAEARGRGISATGGDIKGSDLYEKAGGRDGGSARLREAGLKGAKMSGEYASAGKATDYVVFDDSLIDIVRKYGWAALGLLGAFSPQQESDTLQ